MAHNYCYSVPQSRQDKAIDLSKVYTEPHIQAQNVDKVELTPLKNSSYQNKMNKTAKIVKLRCATKAETEPENRINQQQKLTKVKTQASQQKNERSSNKKGQSELFGRLKKNIIKPAAYKSNRLLQQQICWNNKVHMSYTDLMPNPRKKSMSLSQKKVHQPHYTLKQDDKKSSKSKNKNDFTTLQLQKQSQSKIKQFDETLKNKSGLLKHIESIYSFPYPCNTSIVIDLFNRQNTNKLNSSIARSRDKSHSRERSKGKSNRSLHKGLQKDPISIKNQQRIQSTLQKLKKFQIVNDYASRDQLENVLKGFILAGEPQCKWVLLVIDEVFKKIRNPRSQ